MYASERAKKKARFRGPSPGPNLPSPYFFFRAWKASALSGLICPGVISALQHWLALSNCAIADVSTLKGSGGPFGVRKTSRPFVPATAVRSLALPLPLVWPKALPALLLALTFVDQEPASTPS